MKSINIPTKLKNTFQYKTRELIFKLNQELEGDDFLIDSEAQSYLHSLSQISDIGDRYQVIMRAFADALCE